MAGFRKAKAEQAALKIGIYGASGSGKTFTTLLCAEGLAKVTGKRVAYVDTERGTDFYCQAVKDRSVHPEAFDFDAIYTRSITEVSSAVKGLDPAEHGVVVLDSITHLWEAAMAAYAGRTNAAGQIPFHAWAKIKKPYKDLIAYLLNSPLHVFILGRQGLIWEEDEASGELKNTGTKMKAEGETPYEPHILIHMEAKRSKGGSATITAFAEKDRTGILAGKVFEWPNFTSLVAPLLPLLGMTQAQLESQDAAAARDAENLSDGERERIAGSAALLKEWSAKVDLCQDQGALKGVMDGITPALKAQMLTEDVATLRAKCREGLDTLPAGEAPEKKPRGKKLEAAPQHPAPGGPKCAECGHGYRDAHFDSEGHPRKCAVCGTCISSIMEAEGRE